jgi:hypothetical protein
MQNPYNYNYPVQKTEDFFGRASIIAKIYSRIGAERPQSVSLVGDPKIGKSSLLWYLAQPETKKQFLNDHANYVYFYIPVVDNGDLDFDNFSKMFWKIILTDIDKYLDLEEKTPSYDLFKKIVERLTQNQKKVILFFDDFHLTTQNESFPLEFFSFLRSLANNYNLAFVTTSYLDLQQLCVSKEVEESPFFNIFTNLSLKPFEETEAVQLIIEPSKKHGLDLTEDKDRILKAAKFFPYPLQLACHLLFDLKSHNKESSIDESETFETTFYKNAQSYFENIWSIFDEEQIFVLKEVLSSNKIKNTHQFVLNDLVRRNLLEINGTKVEFVLPHFQKFVTAKLGLKWKESQIGGNGFFGLLRRFLFGEKYK